MSRKYLVIKRYPSHQPPGLREKTQKHPTAEPNSTAAGPLNAEATASTGKAENASATAVPAEAAAAKVRVDDGGGVS